MAPPSHKAESIGDESLQSWEEIGAGAFGQVYRARHTDWGFNVAIKLLHCGDGSIKDQALWQEANNMDEASSPFVLRFFGVYQGFPPNMGSSMRLGIVMELMKMGCLQSLQKTLSGPPPWPLAFRLAHQVALGMNFLHKRTPLLHQDLKPSNVLLDENLNAKLTDFGLSRVSTSVLNCSRATTGEEGGTLAYMPPEAFNPSYKPVRAFDIYSYGILLWSILAGEEPYPAANYSLVALRIPDGFRPPCEEIDQGKADGIGELVDLMKMCWDNEPSKRPPFEKCLQVTECVFSRHERGIRDAVNQVLSKLEPEVDHPPPSTPEPSTFLTQPAARSVDTVDYVSSGQTEGSSKQQDSDVKLSDADKAKFVDDQRTTLIQDIANVMAIVEDLGDMVHPEVYDSIEAKGTRQNQVRVLYTATLRPGGVKVKAAFYNALRKHERYLMERLGG